MHDLRIGTITHVKNENTSSTTEQRLYYWWLYQSQFQNINSNISSTAEASVQVLTVLTVDIALPERRSCVNVTHCFRLRSPEEEL